MTLRANTRRKQVQQLTRPFAITSSAVESKLFGTVRPGTLAVLRLSTSSNLVGRRLAARGRRQQPDTAHRNIVGFCSNSNYPSCLKDQPRVTPRPRQCQCRKRRASPG
jgi:hypothetical protein